jgi:hypothetical protein
MAYFTDLFTVDTYQAYLSSDRRVSGFRETQMGMAKRLTKGDKLVAYIKGLSRWAAVLEVMEGPFLDRSPLFHPEDDPFVIRFRVNPNACLDLEQSIPIKHPEIFSRLSFTRGREDGYWLGPLRRSLQHIDDSDGELLEAAITQQANSPQQFPLDADEVSANTPQRVKRLEGTVTVTVPKDDYSDDAIEGKAGRDSTRIQADLGRLGEAMGFKVWLPRNDRGAVLQHWEAHEGTILATLPLNYDDVTLKTVEQIDVLWLKGRSIQRAFEVEHSTAVYSGLLRMADLLALQPNMDIALHIVAPAARRDKVFSEIKRPVFSLLERHPLGKRCSFIAYEDLSELMGLRHLNHTSDSVLEEYEEFAEG